LGTGPEEIYCRESQSPLVAASGREDLPIASGASPYPACPPYLPVRQRGASSRWWSSRSLNFWIFPEAVIGNSLTNLTCFGTLNLASVSAHHAISCSEVARHSGRSRTAAATASPKNASGIPYTQASETAACSRSRSSIS